MNLRPVGRSALLSALVLVGPLAFEAPFAHAAQPPAPPRPFEETAGDLSPVEIERLFEAYAVVQAQQMLKLSDETYAPFVSRLKALHEVRRRNQQARRQILSSLHQLSRQEGSDESALRDQLRALLDQETRATADARKAYDGIDQLLDLRQQARFRLFEEQMERRKFDLLMRARQANRPGRGPLRPRPPQR